MLRRRHAVGCDLQHGDGAGSFDCTYADGPSSHNPSVTVTDGDGGSRLRLARGHGQQRRSDDRDQRQRDVNEGSLYTLTLGAVTDPGTDTVTDYVVHWGDGS